MTKKNKKKIDFDDLKLDLNKGVVEPTIYGGGFSSKDLEDYSKKLLQLTQDVEVFNLVNEMIDFAYHNGKYQRSF